MNWTKEKPVLDHECLLLSCNIYYDHYYNHTAWKSYTVAKKAVEGLLIITDDTHGEEIPYEDLEGDYYMIVNLPKEK
jgi:hypothetical protein